MSYSVIHLETEYLLFFQCHRCSKGYTGKDAESKARAHVRESGHKVWVIDKKTTCLNGVA